MAQLTLTASELDAFRAIYADVCGEEIEIAEGVFALDQSDVVATDTTLTDFIASQGEPEGRFVIDGHDVASFLAHKGRRVVVAAFEGKTLAAGPGIRR